LHKGFTFSYFLGPTFQFPDVKYALSVGLLTNRNVVKSTCTRWS